MLSLGQYTIKIPEIFQVFPVSEFDSNDLGFYFTYVYRGSIARAPYSQNMVNLFAFGCHVIDRAYVRTYASTDCTGGVGETVKRKGGVSPACLANPHLCIGH